MPFTTAINTELLTTYLEKKFVPALEDELQLQKFTTKATIPAGMGNVLRWNIFDSPAVDTGALTAGSATDNAITIDTTAVEATPVEFGEFLLVHRITEYQAVAGSRQELIARMTYGAARSLDAVVRDGPGTMTGALDTTTDWYCGTGANGGSGTADTPVAGSAAAIIGAAALLRNNSAIGFNGISGHPQRHLAAVLSPTFERDMVQESTAGRMTWAEAVTQVPGTDGQGKWVNGYMGSVYGTACYRTQNFSQTTITSLSDDNYLLAEGGLGSASVMNADPRIYLNGPSAGDVGNPYRNRSTIAWHAHFASALIDSNRVVRMYSLS